jgi:NADPH:quinone reductase-like Zn-dependent oxidoreductase
MRGLPYIARLRYGLLTPKNSVPGMEVAGRVEAVGNNVTKFRPGNEVFGWCNGAFAEYVSVSEDALAMKPSNITLEQAAAFPISAFAALQALRDTGRIQPAHRVLIIGASGGVGTFAVQIAKSYGAEVTGVCSAKNVEMVRTIGADHVID